MAVFSEKGLTFATKCCIIIAYIIPQEVSAVKQFI